MVNKGRRQITVAIGASLIPVGTLFFESEGRRQRSVFQYASSWLQHKKGFALAPSMPLTDDKYTDRATREDPRSVLPAPISDSAPDSWGRGIIQKALGHPPTELEFLLTVDDATRHGALRYIDETGQPVSQTKPPIPRLNNLSSLRSMATAYERDEDFGADKAKELQGLAGSLGGARPKSNFVDANGVLYIAKFTSDRDTKPVERVEVATLRLAKRAGLKAADAHLELAGSDRPVALIRRFDRHDDRRIPYISAQSFLVGQYRESAYYTDLADGIRRDGAEPKRDLEELFRRILFTILVSNNDDHLKNHGFLHAGKGGWILSPAFDINPQPERHRHLETGISPEAGHSASIEAAIDAAKLFNLSLDQARTILTKIVETIHKEWRICCKDAGMTAKQISAYEPAFANDEMKIARRLTSQVASVSKASAR